MTRLRLTGGNPQHPFLTVAEVAGILRVSRMTVYRRIDAGEIEAIRVGRTVRVLRSSLQTWLDDAADRWAAS